MMDPTERFCEELGELIEEHNKLAGMASTHEILTYFRTHIGNQLRGQRGKQKGPYSISESAVRKRASRARLATRKESR